MRTLTIAATAILLTTAACSNSTDAPDPATDEPQPTSAAPSSPSSSPPAPAPSSSDATPTTSPDDDLRAAVQGYSDAFLTGDGSAAYAELTERCQARITEADFTALVGQAADLYGSALQFETYDAEVNGDQARVTYTYAIAAINQQQEPWAREAGSWRNDDC